MYDRRTTDVLGMSPSFDLRDVLELGPVDVAWTSPFKTFEYFLFPLKTGKDV